MFSFLRGIYLIIIHPSLRVQMRSQFKVSREAAPVNRIPLENSSGDMTDSNVGGSNHTKFNTAHI